MTNSMKTLSLLLLALAGCAPANVSPGMTFVVGLNGYHDEMNRLGGRPERWPDRQRTAESLKGTYALTIGGSKEFNRLVDLDLRRREFQITLRQTSVRPARAKEMQDELAAIQRELSGLKEIVKGQVLGALSQAPDPSRGIESVATVGLVYAALDHFSPNGAQPGAAAPATRVGSYMVMDLGGTIAIVRTPEGQTYRCSTVLVAEEGAGITCEPAAK